MERVQRLKQLVFGEGLTIAGARRRLEEERGTPQEDELPFYDEPVVGGRCRPTRGSGSTVSADALRALLEMLSAEPARSAPSPSDGVNGDAAPAPEPLARGRAPKRRRAETAVSE